MPKISNDPATLIRNHGFSFVGSDDEVVLSRVINYAIAANCMYRPVYAFGSKGVLYRGDVPGLTLLMLSDPTLIVVCNRELIEAVRYQPTAVVTAEARMPISHG